MVVTPSKPLRRSQGLVLGRTWAAAGRAAVAQRELSADHHPRLARRVEVLDGKDVPAVRDFRLSEV